MCIIPCSGRALEIILSAQDFDYHQAQMYGTVNLAFDAEEIEPFVENMTRRIVLCPKNSINACKKAV